MIPLFFSHMGNRFIFFSYFFFNLGGGGGEGGGGDYSLGNIEKEVFAMTLAFYSLMAGAIIVFYLSASGDI